MYLKRCIEYGRVESSQVRYHLDFTVPVPVFRADSTPPDLTQLYNSAKRPHVFKELSPDQLLRDHFIKEKLRTTQLEATKTV